MARLGRWMAGICLALALLLAGPLWMLASGGVEMEGHWGAASRAPAGLAPAPEAAPEALVQVYAARAWGWRGAFGVHTWLATREAGAAEWRLHHVLSWRTPALVSTATTTPDRAWYGSPPRLLADYRGARAAALIPAIEAAVAAYPVPNAYRAWPGPNSNTFIAWLLREVEGLDAALPATAVGKDYLLDGSLAPAPGGAGFTVSLGGVLGLTLGRVDGLELNLLGLGVGVDPRRPALKLPGLGRVGMPAEVMGQE